MPNLTKHHFIAKSQSKYLKDMKLNIPQEECIVLLDFSENYSFIVQDAIQGFHWENSQATIHPLVVYGKNNENQLLTVSMCIISDHTIHDTATVFSFQTAVIPSIKEKFPLVKKIIYFSDGSSAQYKNRKNFVNICHHESDFKLKSEWHFFATSHGKSSCDGIGGTVKRLAARTSLHRPYNNQILTAKDLFSFCTATITNIKFFFVPSVNVIEVESKLQQRFNEVPTAILGTRNYHCYIPISNCTSKILVSYLSQSSVKETKDDGLYELDIDEEAALLGLSDEEIERDATDQELEYVDEDGNPVEIGESNAELYEVADMETKKRRTPPEDVLELDDLDAEIESFAQENPDLLARESPAKTFNERQRQDNLISLTSHTEREKYPSRRKEPHHSPERTIETTKSDNSYAGHSQTSDPFTESLEYDEESEDENVADDHRERFKSERSNIITLTPAKKRTDIPDTLGKKMLIF
ncbi:hypothetical protein AVEN_138700-1 [Araneus ventricosus]|uniref:Uncharacterized protein n=1 Tax=Araneus ventricosus TaxID=182803 RepID=A0A4Y2R3M2_ARAVE|nr:hypothetical protein AVEN_138700-1 [Araneus ventricosus]